MPFIGRDWRSPGEVWVKTDEGWERMKLLQSVLSNGYHNHLQDHGFNSGDSSTDSDSENESNTENNTRAIIQRLQKNISQNNILKSDTILFKDRTNDIVQWQPYCQITLKTTKEVAGHNTISEAFYKLDFCNAIRDIRRFNYVSKLLHLLITQNLTSLSGCATRVLFSMLEQLAWQVASNQQNIHILHTLLYDLKKIMRKYYCWGRPLGSTLLWEQHLRTIERICQMANRIEIKQPAEDGSKRLTDLPEEVIREILLRLSDYKDLMNSGQSYDIMQSLLDEQHIWRQLTKYHFTRQQLKWVLANNKSENVDWERIFHQLRKKFGLKEEYADCIFLCRHCRCLFWKSYGHPCVYENQVSLAKKDGMNGMNGAMSSNVENRVVVHNMPFFHHPLVQHYSQQQQNGGESAHKSVPLHIPVPPQAFLKFFSL